MPLYEYRCLSCGHVFDVIQQFSDPPLTTCPECGEAVEKCVSSPALQFKGSGFYITDYSNKGKKPAAAGKKAGAKKEKKKKSPSKDG